MAKIEFHPNLTDSKVVLGVIYMTSCYNVHKVIEVVNYYFNCNPDDKFVYNYFIQTVSFHCRENTLSFLASMFFNTSKGYNNFLRKILNESSVINAIKSSVVTFFDRDNVRIIAKNFVNIFTHENVLDILRSKVRRAIFVTFGYHPAIACDIELQKKWIKLIAENPLFAVNDIPWYITDEGLENVAKIDLDKLLIVFEEFFNDDYYERERKALFSIDTLKKIIALYAISESSSRVQKLLTKINKYHKKGLLLKP